ncbi:MAG: TonB-dependent receptor plug domain-containing protein [Candidatus Kapaibacteriota bacterium]
MRNLYYILFITIFSLNIFANTDTLSVGLKPIEVSAERVSEVNILKGLNFESIKIKNEKNTKEITNYLQESPGIFIKDYGGLGGLKTISLRGTSSNQVVIALNEMPITSTSNPSFDLNEIPINILSNIEIIKNGLSAYYGSNSIGGTINFRTNNSKDSELVVLTSNYGSFGRFQFNFKSNFFQDEFPLSIFMNYTKFDGNYPFKFNNFGNIIDTFRTNSNLNKVQTGLSFDYQIRKFDFSILSFANYSKKGIPGVVLLGKIEDINTTSEDFSTYIIPKITYLIDKSNIISLNNLISIQSITINDFNNVFINNQTNYKFNSNHFKSILNYTRLLTNLDFFIHPEIDYVDLTGTFLQPNLGNFVQQTTLSLSSGINHKMDFINKLWQNSFSLRFDKFSNYKDNPFSFFLGSELLIKNYQLSLFLNISKNFRIPSFSELYYFNYGNLDLKPEKSNSLNFGLTNKSINNLEMKISSYYTLTYDQIVSVPKSTLTWSAQNLGKTKNYGVELALNANFLDKCLFANLSYTLQAPKDITENSSNYNKNIIYIPQEIISMQSEIIISNLIFNISFYYNSFRYFLPDNSFNSLMPSYYLIDLSLKSKLQINSSVLNFQFAVNNITSTNYQIIRNYPMPGRNYLLSITYIQL